MQAMQKLAGRYPRKRILITGATSGLGEALAMRFAAGGFKVAVASRNPKKVEATAARVTEAGGTPLEVVMDVTRLEDFEAAAEQVARNWDGLDILVNNAGVITGGKVADIGLEPWRQSLETDLWSVIHGCRLLLPLLERSGGGHLVNVASAAGLLSPPDLATYNVAKAGVICLSETLATELAEKSIDVTVSCPTVFKSNLLAEEGHEGDVVVGEMVQGLVHDMEVTSISSDQVARSLIHSMAKRRLYNVPQRDARINWWLSRAFPEIFRRTILYMYRHKIWVFKTD